MQCILKEIDIFVALCGSSKQAQNIYKFWLQLFNFIFKGYLYLSLTQIYIHVWFIDCSKLPVAHIDCSHPPHLTAHMGVPFKLFCVCWVNLFWLLYRDWIIMRKVIESRWQLLPRCGKYDIYIHTYIQTTHVILEFIFLTANEKNKKNFASYFGSFKLKPSSLINWKRYLIAEFT